VHSITTKFLELNFFADMSPESDDDLGWYETYPRNSYLLLSPSNQPGVMIPLTMETKLPHRFISGKGQQYVVYNDLTVSYNGNRSVCWNFLPYLA
jgi:hypothetical protein